MKRSWSTLANFHHQICQSPLYKALRFVYIKHRADFFFSKKNRQMKVGQNNEIM